MVVFKRLKTKESQKTITKKSGRGPLQEVLIIIQGRIQDFSKKGVVSMRVQGKRRRGKGMGEGRVMFEYVDFLYFDFRGINLSNSRRYY